MRFESDAVADEGVAVVNMLFSRELRWIFREVGPLHRPQSWSCTTRGTDPGRRVGTDREQLLLAVELAPEAPQLTALGSDADVQSAAIGELVRPVCGLGFANLDIGQHRRPPKYPA